MGVTLPTEKTVSFGDGIDRVVESSDVTDVFEHDGYGDGGVRIRRCCRSSIVSVSEKSESSRSCSKLSVTECRSHLMDTFGKEVVSGISQARESCDVRSAVGGLP